MAQGPQAQQSPGEHLPAAAHGMPLPAFVYSSQAAHLLCCKISSMLPLGSARISADSALHANPTVVQVQKLVLDSILEADWTDEGLHAVPADFVLGDILRAVTHCIPAKGRQCLSGV